MGMGEKSIESFLQKALQEGGSAPLYLQLRSSLQTAMNRGLLRPGAKLLAERALSQGLGISRVTLRKAIDQLCLDGWLVRQQGARTVVAPRLEKMVSKLTGPWVRARISR